MQLERVGYDGASEEEGGKGWGLTRVDPGILHLKWNLGLRVDSAEGMGVLGLFLDWICFGSK